MTINHPGMHDLSTAVRSHNASDAPVVEKRRARTASRVGNPLARLQNVDGRYREAKRFTQIIAELEADLGKGSKLAPMEQALVRQCAANILLGEQLQASLARGEAVSAEEMTRLTNTTAKLLQRLGHRRKAREIQPGQAWTAKVERERAERAAIGKGRR